MTTFCAISCSTICSLKRRKRDTYRSICTHTRPELWSIAHICLPPFSLTLSPIGPLSPGAPLIPLGPLGPWEKKGMMRLETHEMQHENIWILLTDTECVCACVCLWVNVWTKTVNQFYFLKFPPEKHQKKPSPWSHQWDQTEVQILNQKVNGSLSWWFSK